MRRPCGRADRLLASASAGSETMSQCSPPLVISAMMPPVRSSISRAGRGRTIAARHSEQGCCRDRRRDIRPICRLSIRAPHAKGDVNRWMVALSGRERGKLSRGAACRARASQTAVFGGRGSSRCAGDARHAGNQAGRCWVHSNNVRNVRNLHRFRSFRVRNDFCSVRVLQKPATAPGTTGRCASTTGTSSGVCATRTRRASSNAPASSLSIA
jgi:hypothetical protein